MTIINFILDLHVAYEAIIGRLNQMEVLVGDMVVQVLIMQLGI